MGITHRFKNKALYTQALTHRSYQYEHGGESNNERLEFLGDAVLSMICSEYIYREHKDLPEGELTKLRAAIVCEASLCEYARCIGLGELVLLGKGEAAYGGRDKPSVLSDTFEALLAAIYLDGGYDAARKFVIGFIKAKAEETFLHPANADYKTMLQGKVQKVPGGTLSYELISKSGPDHDSVFSICAVVNGKKCAAGIGKNKKQAEQEAARIALESLDL